jgi:FkbM family methyltransferase
MESIRVLTKRLLFSLPLVKRVSASCCAENNLLPTVVSKLPSASLRAVLNLPAYPHSSQLNQDIFALIANRFRPGYFVEIGANDGFTLSNTAYLEEHFGWHGLLIEPNAKYSRSLSTRRNSVVVCKAVGKTNGRADFIDAGLYGGLKSSIDDTHTSFTSMADQILVDCAPLQELLDSARSPNRIDFISIDVEGSELEIVRQMLGTDRRFTCGCIEFNQRYDDRDQMIEMLEVNGYKPVWLDQTAQDLYFVDGNIAIAALA